MGCAPINLPIEWERGGVIALRAKKGEIKKCAVKTLIESIVIERSL